MRRVLGVVAVLIRVSLPVSLATTACDTGAAHYSAQSIAPEDVQSVTIDSGETLTTDPGNGVGFFVEYTRGADTDDWHVYATCDTKTSGYLCSYDIVASIAGKQDLAVVDQADLEKPDRVLPVDDGATRLVFETDEDVDGAVLTVPTGSTLRLDVLWDDAPAREIFHWISDASVHTGAPSDPVDFVPTEP